MSESSHNLLTLIAKANAGVWGRFDHERPHFGNAELAVIVGGTTLLVIVMLVSYWRSHRRKLEFLKNSRTRLFSELSAAHRLDRANRRLIKRLAAANDQKNITALFVEPSYFEPEHLPLSEKIAPDVLRHLRHELFD
jgi:hypothetical protein